MCVYLCDFQENTSSQFEWQLQDMTLKCQQQEEQLVAQQMRIEELEAALKVWRRQGGRDTDTDRVRKRGRDTDTNRQRREERERHRHR